MLVRVGDARPSPFSLLPSRSKLQCILLLLSGPCFISTNTVYVLCGTSILSRALLVIVLRAVLVVMLRAVLVVMLRAVLVVMLRAVYW